MWQCLELLKLKNVTLYHNDIKFVNDSWTFNDSIFENNFHYKISQIPSLRQIEKADIIYRIQCPFNFATSKDKPVFTFISCENGCIPKERYIDPGNSIQTLPSSGITIITPSQWSKNGLLRCGADHNLIEIVPHGVDISIFNVLEPAEKIILKNDLKYENRFVFLHVGAMTPNKGMDLLLKAFAIVNGKYPDTLLCLKGVDSLYNSIDILKNSNFLLNTAENQRVADNLIYIGNDLSFSELAKLYQAADAYITPYRAEGFNMPVLEAAACGLPIICTSGGSTDDFTLDSFAKYIMSSIQTENESVFLEPSLDHLVHQMIDIIEDRSFSDDAAIYGPLHVYLNYTWENIVNKLMQVICRKSDFSI